MGDVDDKAMAGGTPANPATLVIRNKEGAAVAAPLKLDESCYAWAPALVAPPCIQSAGLFG
jgi:hypothetical protein